MTDNAGSKQLDAVEGPSRPAGQSAAPKMRSVRKSKYASEGEALEGLKAFVMGLGVENPAETEAELLMQAAPYMSESLEANLQSAWTPEERARLDAAPIPEKLDHHNRDHEYIFFKQMRKSLERRMSRSSIGSKRESVERRTSAVQQRTSADTTVASLAASSSDSMPGSPLALTAEEASRRRAEQRRANLGAVWGETGRDVLKALDTLPETEDVLLDADGITPPASPTYLPLAEDEEVASEQTPPGNTPPESDEKKEDEKKSKFFCW